MSLPRREVLIIDDNEHDRNLVARILSGNQDAVWCLEECATGADGMNMLRRRKFDCVLLDYILPDEDGVGILKKLRSYNFNTPVVMLTGNGCEHAAIEAFKSGAQDYVCKSTLLERNLPQVIAQAVRHKEDEMRLVKKANYDLLTGLANRALLPERVDQAIARADRTGVPFALIYIDLNGFKKINDTYGHHAGDIVLKEAARRLCQSVRRGDTVSRLGGDEFVAVVEGLAGDGEESSTMAACRMRDKLKNDPYTIDQNEIHMSASIGIALYPSMGMSCDELLAAADRAMYCCKKSENEDFKLSAGA